MNFPVHPLWCHRGQEPKKWKHPHPVAGSVQRAQDRNDGQSIQFNKQSNAEVVKTSIVMTVGSQKWLKMAPPTQPNMEFSSYQQWIGKLKMPLMMKQTSGLLSCNSQTTGWCHYDSIIHSHNSSLSPCTLGQNPKLCRWRLKTKGLEAGAMCHLSIKPYHFIIIYLQALLAHDRSKNFVSGDDGSICRSDYLTATVWLGQIKLFCTSKPMNTSRVWEDARDRRHKENATCRLAPQAEPPGNGTQSLSLPALRQQCE